MQQPEPQWFVLNYISSTPDRAAAAARTVSAFNAATGARLSVFAPTIIEMVERNGRLVRRDTPLIFHYVFVYGTEDQVKRLCAADNGYSLIINRAGSQRYLTVSQADMDAFVVIARAHSNCLPCYASDEVDLCEGDLIRIVDGPFAGLCGRYVPRRGSRSGNVYISVTQDLATVIYNVSADYVSIIEFARDSRRVYDIIDAFVPRLQRAIDAYRPDEPLPPDIVAPLSIFVRRMGDARLNNPKIDGKLQALLRAAHAILGNADAARDAARRLERLAPHITNPATRTLLAHLSLIP